MDVTKSILEDLGIVGILMRVTVADVQKSILWVKENVFLESIVTLSNAFVSMPMGRVIVVMNRFAEKMAASSSIPKEEKDIVNGDLSAGIKRLAR